MKLTIPFIAETFVKFNRIYFGGILPTPLFKINTSKQTLGRCVRKNGIVTIIVSNYYDREQKDFEETILHEMIHQWQIVVYNTANHGATFCDKAREIKSFSNDKYNITRTTNVNAPISEQGQAKVNRSFIPPIAVIKVNNDPNKIWLIRLSKPQYKRYYNMEIARHTTPIGYLYNIPITNPKFPTYACRTHLRGKAMPLETFYREYAEYAAKMTLEHINSTIIK